MVSINMLICKICILYKHVMHINRLGVNMLAYNKHRTIVTNGKVPASLPIFNDMVHVWRHTDRVPQTDSQTLVVFDHVMRVHELSRFPGHCQAQNSEMSGFLHQVADTRKTASTPKRKARALAFLPGVCGLSWRLERGVPPRGCATASSGRMRTFLCDSRSFLLYRSLKPLFSSPTLSPTNSKDHS